MGPGVAHTVQSLGVSLVDNARLFFSHLVIRLLVAAGVKRALLFDPKSSRR